MDGYDYQMCYECDGRGKVHYMVLFSRTCPRCKGRGKVRTPDFNWLKHSEPTLPSPVVLRVYIVRVYRI